MYVNMGKYTIIDGIVTIPEGVTVIAAEEFYECPDLIKVILPSTITEISRIAFQECVNLESINIPEGVKRIGNSAFEHCCGLTSIHIPAATDVKRMCLPDVLASEALPSLRETLTLIHDADVMPSSIPQRIRSYMDVRLQWSQTV